MQTAKRDKVIASIAEISEIKEGINSLRDGAPLGILGPTGTRDTRLALQAILDDRYHQLGVLAHAYWTENPPR